MKYFRPDTFKELGEILNQFPKAKLLAGGTDVMPGKHLPSDFPEQIVDLKHLPDLNGITQSENHVTIGALTTIEEIRRSPVMEKKFPALVQAANEFAGMQIRNRGTVGGNIMNASPAGDLIPPMMIYDATLTLRSQSGIRTEPLESFMKGPGKTDIKPGEILSQIRLEKSEAKSEFYKLGLRQSMAISVINFALNWRKESGKIAELKIAAGAVAPTVVFLQHFTDAILGGKSVDEALPLIDDDINPIDDIRASANYRRTVLKNVLKHRLNEVHLL